MQVFRPAIAADVDDIYELALQGGAELTSLIANKDIIAVRINASMDAFSKPLIEPQDENYLFVLEDKTSSRIIGTSAIDASVGYHNPTYFYRLAQESRICQQLAIRTRYQSLHLNNDFDGLTEICSLWLHPELRQKGNAHLLSRGLFLFMAKFHERFAATVFAEIRGVLDEKGKSPFWESLGKSFFLMEFGEADHLTTTTNKQFIADLMPRDSIYTHLLSKEAQRAIGQPNAASQPALRLFQQEGFTYHGYVDIFDAGPIVQVEKCRINTIVNSKVLPIIKILPKIREGTLYIVSNDCIDFRACYAPLSVTPEGVTISEEVAELLDVKVGSSVRCILSKIET